MLSEGNPEEEILQSYISAEGESVLWVTPGLAGKAAPYAAIGIGFGCVALVIRRYLRRRSATPAMDEATVARLTKGFAEEID
jgi:hypothetical protein